jgi:hypothetical protein
LICFNACTQIIYMKRFFFLQWGLKPCHNFNWRFSSRPNFTFIWA